MIDALSWVFVELWTEIGSGILGITILVLVIEMIVAVKEWTQV